LLLFHRRLRCLILIDLPGTRRSQPGRKFQRPGSPSEPRLCRSLYDRTRRAGPPDCRWYCRSK
jgi:hypothetical protein